MSKNNSTNVTDYFEEVLSLIVKAEDAHNADEALKFSQAACNASNALAGLRNILNIK